MKNLQYLGLPNPNLHKIVETDASDVAFGGILKQNVRNQGKLVIDLASKQIFAKMFYKKMLWILFVKLAKLYIMYPVPSWCFPPPKIITCGNCGSDKCHGLLAHNFSNYKVYYCQKPSDLNKFSMDDFQEMLQKT